ASAQNPSVRGGKHADPSTPVSRGQQSVGKHAAPAAQLPNTGAESSGIASSALLLMLAGTGAVAYARKRAAR
ncbi:LPXTG cell wall anchor domain-containing protein, partial [Actinotignum timonense]